LGSTTSARETPASTLLIVAGAALLKLQGSRNFDPLTGGSAQRCSLSVEAALLLLQ
jgi:hypothetical protein